jgi:hypothetical protein
MIVYRDNGTFWQGVIAVAIALGFFWGGYALRDSGVVMQFNNVEQRQ